MRIAQLAPLYVPVPPTRYGGTERVVSVLADELARRGHDVTLFAAGGSETLARLHPVSPRPIWELNVSDPTAWHAYEVMEAVRMSDRFDVIHAHLDYLPWIAGAQFRSPVVTTLHGRLDLPEYGSLFAASTDQALVSISDKQREPLAHLPLNWRATIHHGLNLSHTFDLGAGDGGYVLFLGRMSPEKDPALAIRAAIEAGIPIKLAGPIHPVNQAYFDAEVKPLLEHPDVEWVGEADDRQKNQLLGGAIALIAPQNWDEPFGLMFIESLACGTPVITPPRGAAPEIIESGIDGFLCADQRAMAQACLVAGEIDRARCRRRALERFSTGTMVDKYEAVYRGLVAEWAEPAAIAAPVAAPSVFQGVEVRPIAGQQPALEPTGQSS